MSATDNINGIYAKDTELRNGISELRGDILSQTIKPLSITENGTYTSDPSAGAYGYSPITVDVQEEPWQPLQDGYSNFWFELTNDTLSPWLNFSAKTENAVIDWGDGSGEQALDTLTPTHTYSKAGKYVVKCKGVTAIARQFQFPLNGKYVNSFKYAELNSDVTSLSNSAFNGCNQLKKISLQNSNITTITLSDFQFCSSLESISIPNGVTSINGKAFDNCLLMYDVILPSTLITLSENAFSNCYCLNKITIPQTVTSLGNAIFAYCYSLTEIHIQATVPPTLGTNAFYGMPSDYIIYVPQGYGDTYKAASGWSTYADHILEEGQTPNRAMLAKFNSNNTDNEEMR